MSYPPPPGPPSGPPNQPNQSPGWQQQPQGGSSQPQGGSHQPQGGSYQPQGGSYQPQGGSYQPQGGTHQPQGGSYQPQGGAYQPQGGNWAAPPYGGPPRKDRAGLIIVLMAIGLAIVLGLGGFVAYNLTARSNDGGSAPAAAPASEQATPEPEETPTAPPTTAPPTLPTPTTPTKAPTKAPPLPVPSKPVSTSTKAAAIALAGKFVGHLNAGNANAATALGCADTKAMIPTLITVWIKAPTSLKVGDVAIGQDPYIVSMSGTTGGKKMGGMVIVQGSCVRVFQLSPS